MSDNLNKQHLNPSEALSPNARAFAAMEAAQVQLDGVRAAGEVSTKIGRRRYLHAGPPIALADIPGPMRGALIGGLLFEREAVSQAEAEAIIDAGEVEISPCHDAGAVGAMAGIITPNMPVAVARSSTGDVTFSPLNEGVNGAVRYGSFDPETLARLGWMSREMAPILDAAICQSDPFNLVDLVAEGLRRGDDCHNRLVASTAVLLQRLTPALIRLGKSHEDAVKVAQIIAGNGHFALPFAISMAKARCLAAAGITGSSLVTTMSGNGRTFGIRVSGLGERWFLAPSPIGEPKLIPGARIEDVTPTMGDSMISETAGFGAFAMSAAPALMSFVGGTVAQGVEIVAEMRKIAHGTSKTFLIPAEEHRGTPVGIDVHLVAETGIAPVINNGLSHRQPGMGRIGAGITRTPFEIFEGASRALRGQSAP